MVKMDFGGVEEEVVTRDDLSFEKAKDFLMGKKIAVIGYGVQGQGQGLNLRDNGFDVIVGQRKGTKSWGKAAQDNWGDRLMEIEEACEQADIILYLLSDAGQKDQWGVVKKYVSGKTLCFAHGFSIVYRDQTKVEPPKDTDVILVVPKGAGLTVRREYLAGRGINSSIAVWQDVSGDAEMTAKSLGMCIGSHYLFPTTFEREVFCNLTAERGVLVGALAGIMEAQYNELRKRGHLPSEAYNETVDQLTQSLMSLIGENGMDFLLENISATAQRGALDWKEKFKKAVEPAFDELYDRVKSGEETKIVLEDKDPTEELEIIKNSEMWRTGKTIRSLRPE